MRRHEADADLEPLETDPELLPTARAHALDMLERGYFDHVTPGGLDPSDRVALLHRRLVGGVGENIAEHRGLSAEQLEAQVGPLAVKIMDGLIQSPAHRENILNPEYTHLAIAAVAKGEGLVVVQLFEARRALLAERLPLHVRRGEKLPLKFEQGQGPRSTPTPVRGSPSRSWSRSTCRPTRSWSGPVSIFSSSCFRPNRPIASM